MEYLAISCSVHFCCYGAMFIFITLLLLWLLLSSMKYSELHGRFSNKLFSSFLWLWCHVYVSL